MGVIFNLSLSQSSSARDRPVNGLFAAIDETFFDKGGKGAENFRFVTRVERTVLTRPVGENAKSLELGTLTVDIRTRILGAGSTNFELRL